MNTKKILLLFVISIALMNCSPKNNNSIIGEWEMIEYDQFVSANFQKDGIVKFTSKDGDSLGGENYFFAGIQGAAMKYEIDNSIQPNNMNIIVIDNKTGFEIRTMKCIYKIEYGILSINFSFDDIRPDDFTDTENHTNINFKRK
ncbi:hypothetical protein [Paenimyroides viscosum]|uniref:Lipocalin-like domain-containing protein n=1 Tax=Paenimyroides viscosum TaxID=2488729 RepID=A0A3P1B6V5_9FLAO|nr:hypothetical protein [Paenimyroides viscosum]RRA96462.1 hypothetical protein EG242_02370 [Paenimyroides viscosum]